MEESRARVVVEHWSGGAGVVARGPKMLMSVVPASPGDIERHTGRRPPGYDDLWRLEVGGRFIASDGLLYPSGVPFPEELHSQTAIISNEVWLYVDDDGYVLGAYWWPDAVRKPIAAMPRDDFAPSVTVHPSDASRRVDVPVPIPDLEPWEPVVAACPSRDEVVVFCTHGSVPEPLNQMVSYEQGGICVRSRAQSQRTDITGFLRGHQPPYRRVQVRGCEGFGRDPGRSLGPQTWPWPGEVSWWADGVRYDVTGFEQMNKLVEIATSIRNGAVATSS